MLRVEVKSRKVHISKSSSQQQLRHDEVRVRVLGTSVNGFDSRQLRESKSSPFATGIEFAGVVSHVGIGVNQWQAGDAVMGLVESGGHADELITHQDLCIRIPENLPTSKSSAFCESYTTAHDALFTTGRLRFGDRLLVSGAAGGVGTAALQLGLSAGAQVVASIRDEHVRARVEARFPAVTVHSPEDCHGSGPFDLILELVGAPNITGNVNSLTTGGRIVVIGRGAGSMASVDLAQLMARRGVLTGSTLKHRSVAEKSSALRTMASAVLPELLKGNLDVIVESEYALTAAREAFEHFNKGGKFGNIVMTTSEGSDALK